MRINRWMWWLAVILLYLRNWTVEAKNLERNHADFFRSSEEVDVPKNTEDTFNSTKVEEEWDPNAPKTARLLGVHNCETNQECVHGGICHKGKDGNGICLCPRSCPATMPYRCGSYRNPTGGCLPMDKDYRLKYDVREPTCYQNECVCPPAFDTVYVTADQKPLRLNSTLLPTKCDKRDLAVVGRAYPALSVFKGTDVTLFCCVNVDPEGFIDVASVFFVQNATIMREPTSHPFVNSNGFARRVHERQSCWELELKNAQPSDSGSYMCRVSSSQPDLEVNDTMQFEVKAPRMISKLSVNASEREAVVTWESEGAEIPIDLRLVRRTDSRGHVVYSKDNVTSPVIVKDLRAATPYTLFVSGKDGMAPFEFTEHFSTKQKRPFPPKEEDVRVLNSGSSLSCEVEWKSPAEPNGRIIKYFVSVRGGMRTSRPDGSLTPDDFPIAEEVDKRCANWDEDESSVAQAGINPIDFSNDFYSCKFGPLKPNRNYSVTVWAENSAGRSQPAVFKKNCVTNYAQPDIVESPKTDLSNNQSTFSLSFSERPDDINGPISCYYIAIVPLPVNVSLDILPRSDEIVMDSFSKVFTNNLHSSAAEKKRFFAYVAESYSQFPDETIIGDGVGVTGLKPCNVQYLSRYSAEDLALRTGLKYTGFLIVRVDKEEELNKKDGRPGQQFLRNLLDKSTTASSRRSSPSSRRLRQLHLSGPAYGYSDYFKPIHLTTDEPGSALATAAKIVIPIVLFLVMATAIGMCIVHRRGGQISFLSRCPLFKIASKDFERQPLKPTYGGPILLEDLPAEYVMRHRDSDFVFINEYENLPHFKFETVASKRKENAIKNRYNDISAFDETRVRLKKIENDENSDYINANFIKSWNSKKLFIAAQAPVDATVDDFWRMIWEQESYLVVMVANLTEKNRQQCSKYWPDEEITRYGDIIVEPATVSFHSDYAIRAFDIAHISECGPDVIPTNNGVEYANVPMSSKGSQFASNSRRILQYHFTNWNDYKAPECTTGMLRFMYMLRELPQFNESPVVIHCSAGVGRTGTFITIDSMFDQALAEGKVNVYEFVCNLRRQRNLMVQSVEQYVFIYKALAEWHMYGYTDMDVGEFEDHYQRMMEVGHRNLERDRAVSFNQGSSGSISPRVVIVSSRESVATSATTSTETNMEEEFKRLERNLSGPLPTNFASYDENLMRNRFEAAVPYDKYRVILPATIGGESTYINASPIRGYFYDYIAAQDPVSASTVFDFWRMIDDQKVTTVVMLSDEQDWAEDEKYWPHELGATCHFSSARTTADVTCLSEEHHPDFTARTLAYSLRETAAEPSEPADQLVQYSYTAWPSESLVPRSSASLMHLISLVLQRQSNLVESKAPIVVHCRNGSSETGIFICISLLLLRLKAEQRIDIFQTVHGLQSHRPQMFTKFEQYQFCYKSLADYVSKAFR